MIDKIKLELLEDGDEYLIIENDRIISHSKEINSFTIDKSINLKVIYLTDQNTSINFKILGNLDVGLVEIFYDLKDTDKIELNYDIEENTRVNYLSVRNTKINDFKIITNISLARDAYINIKELAIFENSSKSNTNVYLRDTGSNAVIKNVYLNSTSKKQNYTINTFHEMGNTTSEIKVYGIAKNASEIVVDTKGFIRKDAAGANLNQKTKALILDEASHISANPILEIDHYDCYAGHGASIGALDDDELYYLMSRGLTRDEAEKLIVNGFIVPFYNEIEDSKIQEIVESMIRPLI